MVWGFFFLVFVVSAVVGANVAEQKRRRGSPREPKETGELN